MDDEVLKSLNRKHDSYKSKLPCFKLYCIILYCKIRLNSFEYLKHQLNKIIPIFEDFNRRTNKRYETQSRIIHKTRWIWKFYRKIMDAAKDFVVQLQLSDLIRIISASVHLQIIVMKHILRLNYQ